MDICYDYGHMDIVLQDNVECLECNLILKAGIGRGQKSIDSTHSYRASSRQHGVWLQGCSQDTIHSMMCPVHAI
jgi:hypothetical protein